MNAPERSLGGITRNLFSISSALSFGRREMALQPLEIAFTRLRSRRRHSQAARMRLNPLTSLTAKERYVRFHENYVRMETDGFVSIHDSELP